MFKFRYILLLLLVTLISGCAKRRVITINTDNIQRANTSPIRYTPREQEDTIKEEILIKNNPSIRNIVNDIVKVPKNSPTIAIGGSGSSSVATSSELNGQTMQRMDFPIDEYRGLRKNGSSTVSGRVYLINSITDEEIVRKNLKLYLNPVTSYSREWYQQSYLGGYKMSPPDKRLYNYLKFTTTNSSGEFSFFGVPAGDYYIGAKFTCEEECGFSSKKIIRVVKEISVGYGTTNIELTKVVP